MTNRDALSYSTENRSWLQDYLPKEPPQPHSDEDNIKPFVTLTFATSLDSALSAAPGTQTVLSGPESKAMTHYLRSKHDAILIGVGTAVADNPSLNCRLLGVGGYGGNGLEGQPRPIVIDPNCRWHLESDTKILKLAREGKGLAPWIVTSKEPSPDQKRLLEEADGNYVQVESNLASDQGPYRMSWQSILSTLSSRGITSVMIEGGGSVINSLLAPSQTHLVDSVIITIAPVWLGEGGVVVSPRREGSSALPVARLSSPKWHQLGQDAVLCGFFTPRNG